MCYHIIWCSFIAIDFLIEFFQYGKFRSRSNFSKELFDKYCSMSQSSHNVIKVGLFIFKIQSPTYPMQSLIGFGLKYHALVLGISDILDSCHVL